MTVDESALVAQRYGTRRKLPSRRTLIVLGSAVMAAVLAFCIWVITFHDSGVVFKDVGYDITSETSASVDYQVTKDFDTTAQCVVQILDSSYAVVGSSVVTLGPHEGSGTADRTQIYRSELRTEHRGVSGVVDDCWELD